MEDDHVDRPGVQARQRVELTGTNRSIGLIPLMVHVRGFVRKDHFACRCEWKRAHEGFKPADAHFRRVVLGRSGDWSEAPEPDPISNSAVKRLSANGTVSQDPGE